MNSKKKLKLSLTQNEFFSPRNKQGRDKKSLRCEKKRKIYLEKLAYFLCEKFRSFSLTPRIKNFRFLVTKMFEI